MAIKRVVVGTAVVVEGMTAVVVGMIDPPAKTLVKRCKTLDLSGALVVVDAVDVVVRLLLPKFI